MDAEFKFVSVITLQAVIDENRKIESMFLPKIMCHVTIEKKGNTSHFRLEKMQRSTNIYIFCNKVAENTQRSIL